MHCCCHVNVTPGSIWLLYYVGFFRPFHSMFIYPSENCTNPWMLGPILSLIFWLQFKIIYRVSILFISPTYAEQSNPQYMYTMVAQFFSFLHIFFIYGVSSLTPTILVFALLLFIRDLEVLGLLLFHLTFLEFVPCSKGLFWGLTLEIVICSWYFKNLCLYYMEFTISLGCWFVYYFLLTSWNLLAVKVYLELFGT